MVRATFEEVRDGSESFGELLDGSVDPWGDP